MTTSDYDLALETAAELAALAEQVIDDDQIGLSVGSRAQVIQEAAAQVLQVAALQQARIANLLAAAALADAAGSRGLWTLAMAELLPEGL